MPNNSSGYRQSYTVGAFDIDAFKRMTAPALLRVLNEVAMQHVLALQLSVWDLEPHQIAWVLLRLEIRIHRLPELGEELSIHTQPSGFERVFTYRDYRVTDAEGKLIVDAATTWALFNIESRRPTRIPSWIPERIPSTATGEEPLPRPVAQLPEWTAADHHLHYTVGWHDLDFNWHLNNTHFLRLLLDSVPSSILRERTPRLIRLHYKAEAALADEVIAETAVLEETHCLHQLRRGDVVLAQAETVWQ